MLFVLHAIDKPESGEIRKTNRDAHLEYLARFDIRAAGPLLDSEHNMTGSCIIIEVDDYDRASEFATNDPYAKAGLFSEVKLHEFRKVIWP